MSGIVPIRCTLPLFSGIYRDIDAKFTELKRKRFKFSPGVGGRRAGSSGILCEKGHGRAARWGGAGLSFPCLSTKSAQILQCAATSAQYYPSTAASSGHPLYLTTSARPRCVRSWELTTSLPSRRPVSPNECALRGTETPAALTWSSSRVQQTTRRRVLGGAGQCSAG